MVVRNWASTLYPTALDSWVAAIDLFDDVMASHPNALASAIYALETKLGIDNARVRNVGGLQFDPVGKAANPGAPGEPTLWVDNAAPGFKLYYTDDIGSSYDLTATSAGAFIGYGYSHVGVAVGDLVYVSAANTVALADAVVGNSARGMVINVAGGLCDIAYGAEITNGAWGLTSGATYYLDVTGGFATAPPVAWTVQQEIGFARNATTMVFRPTITTT